MCVRANHAYDAPSLAPEVDDQRIIIVDVELEVAPVVERRSAERALTTAALHNPALSASSSMASRIVLTMATYSPRS